LRGTGIAARGAITDFEKIEGAVRRMRARFANHRAKPHNGTAREFPAPGRALRNWDDEERSTRIEVSEVTANSAEKKPGEAWTRRSLPGLQDARARPDREVGCSNGIEPERSSVAIDL